MAKSSHERNDKTPPGYQFVKLHIIFDVKIDFTRRHQVQLRIHL